ncbi:DUF2634 domain-containing protein [Anaerotruncus rubiinfantis]|uniref:DUF2634 domain-containing protein n=2 Tax=Anaerotruncus rubiinfantis TaxID=1720200 RepID=UPI001FA97C86|nr:DUF2634 domain-containing protein [Anaerotruncus rubiinfantis]
MTDLFPMIQPQTAEVDTELPLYKEAAWDFEKEQPIFRGGNPVIVTGKEAVKVWCWKALLTERTRYEIYSWDFGSEVESLIGQNYSDELKQAEAVRYVREALEINPYVTDISSISVSFADGVLAVSAAINTIYGEVSARV